MANWIRYFSLVVGTSDTQVLDLSSFRVQFSVSQAVLSRPCTANVRVFNVGAETISKIKVGKPIVIEAGYVENHGVIFRGVVVAKHTGRDTNTETFMDIVATAGGVAHSFATMVTSVPAGANDTEVLGRVKDSYATKDVKAVQTPELRKDALPRGRVFFANTADVMSEIAQNNGLQWGYTEDGVVAMPTGGRLPGKAIVLTGKTGLEGRPTMTVGGLNVKARLNPALKLGACVLIDNSGIQSSVHDTTMGADLNTNFASDGAMLDSNGLYKILSREHSGDTHGNEWTTALVCEGVNAAITPGALSSDVYGILANGT